MTYLKWIVSHWQPPLHSYKLTVRETTLHWTDIDTDMQWIVAANHYCCLMTRLSVSSISSPSPNPLQFFSLLNSFSIQNNSSATFILTCVCISKIGVDYLENNCAEEPNKLCEFKRLSGRILKTVDSVYQDVSNIDECRELCLNSPYRYRLKSIYMCYYNIYEPHLKTFHISNSVEHLEMNQRFSCRRHLINWLINFHFFLKMGEKKRMNTKRKSNESRPNNDMSKSDEEKKDKWKPTEFERCIL